MKTVRVVREKGGRLTMGEGNLYNVDTYKCIAVNVCGFNDARK